jgi:hypothetical protein
MPSSPLFAGPVSAIRTNGIGAGRWCWFCQGSRRPTWLVGNGFRYRVSSGRGGGLNEVFGVRLFGRYGAA